MQIEITTKKAEGVERLLEVSVPVDVVREAEEKAVRRYASQARLPGFRPGKAPAAMVRKKFAAAIRQETLEALMQDAYREVLERENLTPVAQPHVHHVHFDEGKPLSFELHVEVRPEIELARTQGFRVARAASTVTDEQVAEQIERMREQKATLAPVDGKPAPGDLVTVTLATAEDGGEMPAEGKEYRLELGGGQAIPGIEELIMDLTPGETAERSVRWPDDFPDEAQRGATKLVRVTLSDVKRRDLPVLDDAFAREVGDFDSLDALRTAVREDLQRHADRDADAEVRQKIVDEIIAANPFDVPSAWVGQLVGAYAQAYQVPEEQREQFQQEFRSVAERQVRRDLVIDTIAEREGLAASEADIDARVAEVAAQRGSDPGKIYASLQKAGRLKEIERGITEEKVFAWLMERNTVE
ncbi:MAG TPA: trigger factor [Gemmatimonadaceae bacterium]